MPNVIANIVSHNGTCGARRRAGDKFIIGQKTPPDLCLWTFYTLFPFGQKLHLGGSFHREQNPKRATVARPDPANPLVFELRRTRPWRKGSKSEHFTSGSPGKYDKVELQLQH
jgi:uncharacterized repeat protein (TIGR04076 family)